MGYMCRQFNKELEMNKSSSSVVWTYCLHLSHYIDGKL